jgi:hypothetical protein
MGKNDFAQDYDDLQSHVSDNAYLYYIHFRIGHTNAVLNDVRALLFVIAALLGGILWRVWS